MRTIAAVTCIVALAACAAPTGTPPAPSSPGERAMEATPTPTLEPASEPLEPASEQPSADTGSTGGIELTGTLGADAIEGGCGYLRAADGTKYEVIYPDGWHFELGSLELISPDGQVVARGGDEVTVRGSEAGDMASICQIGPIFRATEVVRP